MTYVITEPCVGVKDASCVEECPVDCIFDAGDMFVIDHVDCIDCGACLPACPVNAIFAGDEVPARWAPYAAVNRAWRDGGAPAVQRALEPLRPRNGAER